MRVKQSNVARINPKGSFLKQGRYWVVKLGRWGDLNWRRRFWRWMNHPPGPCVNGSRALHAGSKFLWFRDRAAMMAFCNTRSTWKVSKLFDCICDWVRANRNNGNVLRAAKYRLVSVSDGPSRRKADFGRALCWPCRVCCAVNKYVEAIVQGEGPGRQQAHAHLHGGGAARPPGLLCHQPGGPPNALWHGEGGGMRKFRPTRARREASILPPCCLGSGSHARPANRIFQNIARPFRGPFVLPTPQFPPKSPLWPCCPPERALASTPSCCQIPSHYRIVVCALLTLGRPHRSTTCKGPFAQGSLFPLRRLRTCQTGNSTTGSILPTTSSPDSSSTCNVRTLSALYGINAAHSLKPNLD